MRNVLRLLEEELENQFDVLNHRIKAGAEASLSWSDGDLQAAQTHAEKCRSALGGIFDEFDVILTASTVGEATEDLVGISDSCFNRIWTMMHGPCVTIPAFSGPNGMPVGIQVVGRPGDDANVIEIAGWITRIYSWVLLDKWWEIKHGIYTGSLACRTSSRW